MNLTWRDCLKIGVSAFGLYLAVHYWGTAAAAVKLLIGASVPMLIGAAIAYMVNILMAMYETHFPWNQGIGAKLRRPLCMTGAYVSLVAVVVLVIRLILPQLASCFQLLAAQLPAFMEKALVLADEWGLFSEEMLAPLRNIDWKNTLGQVWNALTSGLGSVMDVVVSTVSTVFSGVVTGVVALIFSMYLLADKEALLSQGARLARRYLPEKAYRQGSHLTDVLNDCFHRYIVGQCLEAVILGSLCAVGMILLKLPYWGMIGALVAFTALIPVAGAYIGAGVGAFMILMVDPVKALVFLVFLVILQQLEGNLIYPRVVGSSMGLPGIWVLAAVTVGGGILGIAGMFLGVPLAAAAYRLIREDVKKGEVLDTLEEPEIPQILVKAEDESPAE